MKVIYNGLLIPEDQSNCNEQGWLNGAGIFETIKTVDGKAWALSRHMRRAVNSAQKTDIRLPNEEVLRDAIACLLVQSHQLGVLRISFDRNGDWAAVHRAYVEQESAAKVRTHPVPVVNLGVPVKSYPYSHRLEILQSAHDAGFDEALVSNSAGKLCEGSVTNILCKIANQWCTPPLSDGALPGVMRALVIENCDVVVRSIGTSEIEHIESAFLLSSLRIAQPIESIDGRELSQSFEFRDEIEAMALRTSVG
jgi:branched-chain amino acid aminotransferase